MTVKKARGVVLVDQIETLILLVRGERVMFGLRPG